MSSLVLASPDAQVWWLLRLNPGTQSASAELAHAEARSPRRQDPPQPGNPLWDWLL